jgi:hypothetical protein
MTEGKDTTGPSPRDLQALIRAEREATPFLHWRDGDGVQQILMLPRTGERVTIGRRSDKSVSLHWDGEVSRNHALLDPVGDSWTLVDEGSSNGSFVNGDRIAGRHPLGDRETMCFGNTRVSYRDRLVPAGGRFDRRVAGDEPRDRRRDVPERGGGQSAHAGPVPALRL